MFTTPSQISSMCNALSRKMNIIPFDYNQVVEFESQINFIVIYNIHEKWCSEDLPGPSHLVGVHILHKK